MKKKIKGFLTNPMQTILGIDVSSTCIGFGVLHLDNGVIALIEHGHIVPPKKDEYSIVQRLDITCNEIRNLCHRIMPDLVIIEDIIQFMSGASSANTIITLGVFNRLIATEVYRTTQKLPIFLPPQTIRAKIKKFLNKSDTINKEDGPNILKEVFGDKFVIQYKQKGKNKGEPISSTYDEADGVFAAFAGVIKECSEHTCNEMKIITDFYKHKSHADGLSSECKECIRKRNKIDRIEHKEKQLLKAAKQRAKDFNLDFSLKLKDIVIPDKCPVLNISLSKYNDILKDDSPTLDRIDNSKGYIVGNVKVISWRANRLKSDATFEELQKIIEYLKKSYGNCKI